jgi:predicted amidohydrolase YtcJ
MLNGGALHVLGIGEGVSDPVGGSLGRHSTGRLNGIVKDWLPMPYSDKCLKSRCGWNWRDGGFPTELSLGDA